jgi:hypothetical protein
LETRVYRGPKYWSYDKAVHPRGSGVVLRSEPVIAKLHPVLAIDGVLDKLPIRKCGYSRRGTTRTAVIMTPGVHGEHMAVLYTRDRTPVVSPSDLATAVLEMIRVVSRALQGHCRTPTAGDVEGLRIRRDPQVTVTTWDDADCTYAEVCGELVETVTGPEARRHIDELPIRCDGQVGVPGRRRAGDSAVRPGCQWVTKG